MTSRLDKVKFSTILDSDELEISPRKWLQWLQDVEAGVCLITGGPALKQFLDYLEERPWPHRRHQPDVQHRR